MSLGTKAAISVNAYGVLGEKGSCWDDSMNGQINLQTLTT
jgi:hypothetical protein